MHDEIKRCIKGDVITPDNPEYPKAIHRWAINAEKKATVVVFVKDEADVASAISYARKHDLPIAICCGGHNATGASSVAGGLVIDLSRYINGVRVDLDKRLAYVGGGAQWATVDRTAIEYGLATVAGTMNDTGVAGLTLGGGFGWLCTEHGLVIDNLVQVTVMSADGVARKASEKENPDLFFGVRGGGCNFGVVTEFVLLLHPQRRTVYAGSCTFGADKLKEVVEATEVWFPNAGPKEGIIMMPTCLSDGTPVVICYVHYNGSEEEGRTNFKWLLDIGPLEDTTEEMPFEKLNTIQNPLAIKHGNGVYWKGVTVQGPDYETIAKAHKRIIEILSVPPEKTIFHRIAKPDCLVFIGWPGETHSEEKVDEARIYAHEIASFITGGLANLKDPKNRGYNNYDPEGIKGTKEEVQEKAKTNFGEHYPTLQKIKKKYDPDNIFNRWLAITPA